MSTAPERPEIDHRTLKLMVGGIALTLAPLTSGLAEAPLPSISAAYHAGGWSTSLFIGFLFAIASFLAAYNGESRHEMAMSKLAAAASLGVALFPCGCGRPDVGLQWLHFGSAAVMFGVLALFCRVFYRRARAKGWAEALRRAGIYAACGLTIVACMATLALDALLGGALTAGIPRLVFWGEAVALTAFGISWLTASRTLPMLARADERFSPMGGVPTR